MEKTALKVIIEFMVLCGMVIVCHNLITSARKKCEKEGQKYRSCESGLMVKIAINIAYLSPVVCVAGWVVTLNGLELAWKIFLMLVIAIIVFLVIQIPWSQPNTTE